mgnify:CR=1 FL=1
MLYTMTPEVFQEVSDSVAKRLAKHVKDVDSYLLEHMPGLEKKSGREKLAFYRSTDQMYWDRLAMVNLARAVSNMLEWAALTRKAARGWQ